MTGFERQRQTEIRCEGRANSRAGREKNWISDKDRVTTSCTIAPDRERTGGVTDGERANDGDTDGEMQLEDR